MTTTNGVGRIGIRQSPPQYLLDGFPGAALAFSMRRLNSAYNGPVIRIRRASDNAETNINFDPVTGTISKTEMTSFCQYSDGYIVTVYDQSGNANNLNQPTATAQARVYGYGGDGRIITYADWGEGLSSGSMALNGKKPFNMGGEFNLTNNITPGANWTSFAIQNGNSVFGGLFNGVDYGGGITTSFMFYGQLIIDNGSKYRWYDGTNTNSGPFYNTNILITTTNVNNEISAMINNSTMNPPYRAINTYVSNSTTSTFTKFHDGKSWEFILYTTDKSVIQADIRSKMLEYYPIY